MKEIDEQKLMTLLGEAHKALGQLESLAQRQDDEILGSQDRLGNLKYQWVVLMEACIDMCNHVSVRSYGKTPESYAGCFDILRDAGAIPAELASEMGELARFRNVLVHLYWTVDNTRVIRHTKTRLDVVKRYLREIADKLKLYPKS
jgi:uncharacterized protein YutE (UPF0331/DUF86 family)